LLVFLVVPSEVKREPVVESSSRDDDATSVSRALLAYGPTTTTTTIIAIIILIGGIDRGTHHKYHQSFVVQIFDNAEYRMSLLIIGTTKLTTIFHCVFVVLTLRRLSHRTIEGGGFGEETNFCSLLLPLCKPLVPPDRLLLLVLGWWLMFLRHSSIRVHVCSDDLPRRRQKYKDGWMFFPLPCTNSLPACCITYRWWNESLLVMIRRILAVDGEQRTEVLLLSLSWPFTQRKIVVCDEEPVSLPLPLPLLVKL